MNLDAKSISTYNFEEFVEDYPILEILKKHPDYTAKRALERATYLNNVNLMAELIPDLRARPRALFNIMSNVARWGCADGNIDGIAFLSQFIDVNEFNQFLKDDEDFFRVVAGNNGLKVVQFLLNFGVRTGGENNIDMNALMVDEKICDEMRHFDTEVRKAIQENPMILKDEGVIANWIKTIINMNPDRMKIRNEILMEYILKSRVSCFGYLSEQTTKHLLIQAELNESYVVYAYIGKFIQWDTGIPLKSKYVDFTFGEMEDKMLPLIEEAVPDNAFDSFLEAAEEKNIERARKYVDKVGWSTKVLAIKNAEDVEMLKIAIELMQDGHGYLRDYAGADILSEAIANNNIQLIKFVLSEGVIPSRENVSEARFSGSSFIEKILTKALKNPAKISVTPNPIQCQFMESKKSKSSAKRKKQRENKQQNKQLEKLKLEMEEKEVPMYDFDSPPYNFENTPPRRGSPQRRHSPPLRPPRYKDLDLDSPPAYDSTPPRYRSPTPYSSPVEDISQHIDALIHAASIGKLNVVKHLIEVVGVDPRARGDAAILAAQRGNHKNVVGYILRYDMR